MLLLGLCRRGNVDAVVVGEVGGSRFAIDIDNLTRRSLDWIFDTMR